MARTASNIASRSTQLKAFFMSILTSKRSRSPRCLQLARTVNDCLAAPASTDANLDWFKPVGDIAAHGIEEALANEAAQRFPHSNRA